MHFIVLLGSALAVSIAAERLRLPAAVLLVAAGVISGFMWHVHIPFSFGPALMFMFLPPLIFEAAWHLDLTELQKNALRIFGLAFPGTILTALVVALLLSWGGILPFASAMVLGAIVAATDPVAVVAIFRVVRVPKAITTIVEAESLANDGVAVILYSIAVTLATSGAISWTHDAGHGLIAIGFGSAIGAACAFPLWLLLSSTDSPEYEITGTIALAYLAYLTADSYGFSGIFASASAAVALRLLLRRRPHMSNRGHVQIFWDAAAYMANAVVFLATGLLIVPARILHEPALIVCVLAMVALVRVGLSCLVVSDIPGRLTVFLAGMRGALPLALAFSLPTQFHDRAAIIDVVFATVLFTLVLQGGFLRVILNRMYGSMAR
ncbi:MAG: cation:proton antiporter [Candidatus Eremiobacteraeota bacterium]|nr:cation:proton antiporter [Candidatus Eremiobacteraeota bacterium]